MLASARFMPCPPILIVIHIDRISRRSHSVEGFQVGDLKITSLLFAVDVPGEGVNLPQGFVHE